MQAVKDGLVRELSAPADQCCNSNISADGGVCGRRRVAPGETRRFVVPRRVIERFAQLLVHFPGIVVPFAMVVAGLQGFVDESPVTTTKPFEIGDPTRYPVEEPRVLQPLLERGKRVGREGKLGKFR